VVFDDFPTRLNEHRASEEFPEAFPLGIAPGEQGEQSGDLEQENARLRRYNTELRRLDIMREQFIQNVSHELRMPLALVQGYVEMLVGGDLEQEEQRQALDVVARQMRALVGLVEAITTFQEMSSQALRVEKLAPVVLLRTACQMAAQTAARSGIKLLHTCPIDLAPIGGDFTRLAQALHQLLDNACKFSPPGSVVTLTAQPAPKGNAICISVSDQGIGISPTEYTHIFERFYQVDGGVSRRYGGMGLGLAMVKEIVEAHSGTVKVQSQLGQGSTFTLTLPVYALKQ
jgi:signal transduction histidine kinase